MTADTDSNATTGVRLLADMMVGDGETEAPVVTTDALVVADG